VPLALLVINAWGWRISFVVFGAVGLIWAAAWQAWYRDRPEDHPNITASELAWIQQDLGDEARRAKAAGAPPPPSPVPWNELFRTRNLYALAVMYFAFGYGLYFYFTWLPTYLIQELGFSTMAGGAFAALPFVLAGAADVGGGWLTDRLSRHFGLRAGRSYLGFAAFFTCGLLLAMSTVIAGAVAKALLLALALASADFGLSAAWAVCTDIAPDHAGVMTGWMNTFGNLGGFVGPLVVGYAIDRWQSWTIPFYIAAVIYVVGAMAWLAIDPTRTLVKGRQS
jgi:nitrate/nitrite transporter NarK